MPREKTQRGGNAAIARSYDNVVQDMSMGIGTSDFLKSMGRCWPILWTTWTDGCAGDSQSGQGTTVEGDPSRDFVNGIHPTLLNLTPQSLLNRPNLIHLQNLDNVHAVRQAHRADGQTHVRGGGWRVAPCAKLNPFHFQPWFHDRPITTRMRHPGMTLISIHNEREASRRKQVAREQYILQRSRHQHAPR